MASHRELERQWAEVRRQQAESLSAAKAELEAAEATEQEARAKLDAALARLRPEVQAEVRELIERGRAGGGEKHERAAVC
jgi:hypothetical protein